MFRYTEDIFGMIVNINLSGDFINCLEVGIWVEQLLSEDGLQQL